MKKCASLRNRLLRVSEQMENQDRTSPALKQELRRLAVKLLRTPERSRPLNAEHVKLIARLFQKTVTESRRIEPIQLLSSVYGDLPSALERLNLIIDLIEMGLIDCDDKVFRRIRDRKKRWRNTIDSSSLIDVYILLSGEFMSFLLNGETHTFHHVLRPFADNNDYLECWFKYVEALYESRQSDISQVYAGEYVSEAIMAWNRLDSRTRVTRRTFPFQRLINEFGLTHDEQVIVMYSLHEALDDTSPSEKDLRLLLSGTRYAKFDYPLALSESGTLLREGIIQAMENSHLLRSSGDYEISPDIAAYILSSRRQSAGTILEEMIKHEDLLSTVSPRKRLADMVLPSETMRLVRSAIAGFKKGNHDTLTEWGVGASTDGRGASAGCSSDPRLVMLLYGPPGTGKTALAYAVARSLRKPLLVTDISKILDKWVGESEKRLSRLFLMYRRIARRTGCHPVLLLNEADQIISKRGGVRHAADRMYNQMQNILLEQLETFTGVLIATTNLIDLIDSAFSRRFDLKIELPRPEAAQRRKLWRALVPDALPLAEDTNFDILAGEYAFTGGQIEVVIRNAAIAAADRTGNDRVVRQEDFIKYAELERSGSFDINGRTPVGFSRS